MRNKVVLLGILLCAAILIFTGCTKEVKENTMNTVNEEKKINETTTPVETEVKTETKAETEAKAEVEAKADADNNTEADTDATNSSEADATSEDKTPSAPAEFIPVEDKEWDTSDVDISWIDPNAKLVAFTFDDGPTAYYDDILDILEEHGMHATFFVWGQKYNTAYEEDVKRVVEQGCELGNHTWSHPYLTKLEPEEIQEEIEKVRALLQKLTGKTEFLVRAPYGSVNMDVRENCFFPLINWSLDTGDWNKGTYESVYAKLTQNVQDGDVVLMHASYKFTMEAVRDAIPYLIDQGYQIVSVSELCKVRGKSLYANGAPLVTKVTK